MDVSHRPQRHHGPVSPGQRAPGPCRPEQVDLHWRSGEADSLDAEQALAACLSPLLARIPDTYRTALELTDLGETQHQAAAQLQLSPSGRKSRVQRSRRMLRDEVVKCCRIELNARGALSDASVRSDTENC